jgi:replicative DNA helicase
MAKQAPDFSLLVHTPAQLSQSFVEYAEHVQQYPGVPFGVKALDEKIIPMRPGNLVCLLGRPGHGKTTLLAYLARAEARRIIKRGAGDSEAVVYITWEQGAEELEAFFQTTDTVSSTDIAWGRADLEQVKRNAVKRARFPIWVIGHGIGRAGLNAPRMTLDAVLGALETMQEKFGVKPALMLFDYMQLIPVNNYRDRVQQVTEVPIRVKELSLRIGAPAVCGVQASREVDDRADKVPEMQDAQWASSIEQTADKVLASMRPIRYMPNGGMLEASWLNDKPMIPVKETTCIIRLLKQRFDQGRYTWVMHFAPQYLVLEEMELRRAASDALLNF